jgi:hypothetical protein
MHGQKIEATALISTGFEAVEGKPGSGSSRGKGIIIIEKLEHSFANNNIHKQAYGINRVDSRPPRWAWH